MKLWQCCVVMTLGVTLSSCGLTSRYYDHWFGDNTHESQQVSKKSGKIEPAVVRYRHANPSPAPAESEVKSEPEIGSQAEVVQQETTSELPEAPQGFFWKHVEDAAILQAKDWNFRNAKEEMNGIDYLTYAASPEMFSEGEPFTTGLTVQLLIGGRAVHGAAPEDVAAVYLTPYVTAIQEGKAKSLIFEKGTQGPYKTILMRYQTVSEGSRNGSIVHKYSVADDDRDTVYIFTYEAPAAGWQQSWETYGRTFFENIKIIPKQGSTR